MPKKFNVESVFFDNPDREVSVREFARLIGVSPVTASTRLRELQDKGIVQCRRERNLLLCKAHEEFVSYKDQKVAYNVGRIRGSGIIEALRKDLHEPLAIFLFGSFAKAENRKESDIDLFVLVRTKMDVDLEEFEKMLGSRIQLLVHDAKDVEILKEKNPHLLNNIVNGIRLFGFWEVF